MSFILYRINRVLARVVAGVPIGTHLGLFHLLWMLLSGRLLQSRGAVIPGLADRGLAADAVRRCWAALAYGTWPGSQLLGAWEHLVREEGCFQAHRYGGYRPVACDLVGFFRPRLRDCPTKHYSSAAGKALPAIPLGIAARVGSVDAQRLAVPYLLVRSEGTDVSEATLQTRLLQQVQKKLADDEAVVCDRGFPSCRSRRPALHAMCRAAPSTSRHGGRPCRPIKARGANRSRGRSCAPARACTRTTPSDLEAVWKQSLYNRRR